MIALSISSCFIFGAHRIILPASLRREEKEYRKERNLIFQILKRNHGGKTAEQRSFSIYTFSMCTTIVPLSPFSLPSLAGRRFRGVFSLVRKGSSVRASNGFVHSKVEVDFSRYLIYCFLTDPAARKVPIQSGQRKISFLEKHTHVVPKASAPERRKIAGDAARQPFDFFKGLTRRAPPKKEKID